MNGTGQIVIFTLDEQGYGIPLNAVSRVVRMVEITPLPGSPAFISGVVNVRGEIMAVIDLRQRFGLPDHTSPLAGQLLITRWGRRSFVLMADCVNGICDCRETACTEAEEIFPDLPWLAGVARLPDGLILLQDLDRLLTTQELQAIDAGLIEAQQ